MVVLNKTRKTIVTKDLKEVKSFLDNLLGLLRQSNSRSLFLKTRFGIHTFCLKDSIDIIILNNNLQVAKLGSSIKPNKLFFWNPKYKLVIELPEGSLNKSHTKIDDMLSLM